MELTVQQLRCNGRLHVIESRGSAHTNGFQLGELGCVLQNQFSQRNQRRRPVGCYFSYLVNPFPGKLSLKCFGHGRARGQS